MYLFQWFAQPTDSSTNYKPTLYEVFLSSSTTTALLVTFSSQSLEYHEFLHRPFPHQITVYCALSFLKVFAINTSIPIYLQSNFPTLFPTILQQEVHAPDKLPWTCLVHSCLPGTLRLYPLSGMPLHIFSTCLNVISLK